MTWLLEPNVCPGLFYGTPAQDGFLIRIRTPGGGLNFQQGQAIATLVEQWGSAAIQVTNRANLQIRAVHTAPTAEVFQTLQTLGLAAQNPSIDHLRNLMTSPTAGIDSQELTDTRPLVQALDAYIQSHPELADLPAKFSIGIDGGGAVGIGTRSEIPWEHRYNEIQLSAVLGSGEWEIGNGECPATLHSLLPTLHSLPRNIYFQLALGGNKQLWDTQVLIQPDQCVSVVAALARGYLDYVNQSPRLQKKPRMKHLLQDWGIERYLHQVNQYLTCPLRPVIACPTSFSTQRYAHLGVHPQRQPGLSYIGIHLSLGQLTATQLQELVQLSKTFGSSELRLTPWQTILLPDIPDQQVAEVLQHLSSLGFSVSDNRVAAAIVACGGKPGCAASKTQTQTHAIALANSLNQHLTLESPVNIHLTGCPKSCAQPSPAEITLLGTTIEQSGETVEGYQIYVSTNLYSCGDSKQEAIQHYLGEVIVAELPSRIEQLLTLYQQRRKTLDESFGEFTTRFSIPTIKQLITSPNL
ncbi:precorrin-3B synthase [Pantanalinema rosaneae CENA516]|uniref:precorrin-3B synthase n=1 Tax=Pantanalinema rosaneae TaxID=1620701 RepID=UPI003D6F780C